MSNIKHQTLEDLYRFLAGAERRRSAVLADIGYQERDISFLDDQIAELTRQRDEDTQHLHKALVTLNALNMRIFAIEEHIERKEKAGQ